MRLTHIQGLALFFFLAVSFSLRALSDRRALSDEIVIERIDINQATAEEIAGLPQVGPSLAWRIVQYRRQQGVYKKPADLLNVKGVGPKRLKQMAPYLIFPSP